MRYIPIEQYSKAWIFRHRDLPIPADQLVQIKPLAKQRAEQVWAEYISRGCSHPEHFSNDDWAGRGKSWLGSDYWQSAWDSDSAALPVLLSEHLSGWEADTKIFFCYQSDHIVETCWQVWRNHWKNFLFFDNGPLLIGRKRNQVVQFFDNGSFRVGKRA